MFFRSIAQPNLYFNNYGSTRLKLQFSSISNRIEYQFDSASAYNSPQFRKKYVKNWNDTVMGLSLNTRYYFRCRFVDGTGNPLSNWSSTTYNTATYPFSELFGQTGPVSISTVPNYRYFHRYDTHFDLWYDTVPDFSSSSLRKFSGNALYSYHKIRLIQNHKQYYLRARVIDGPDSLPWKSIEVFSDFSPNVSVRPNGGCNDSAIAYYLQFANYLQDAVSFSNKTYIRQGNMRDSFTAHSFGVNLQIRDTSPLFVHCHTQIQYDSASLSYRDTQVFRLLDNNEAITYYLISNPDNIIHFTGNSCHTSMELELYADSTLQTLLNSETKSNGKTGSAIWFKTNWDFFKGNVLRYRSKRFGAVTDWNYIYPKAYIPFISHSVQAAIDTNTSQWAIQRSFVFPSRQMEVLLDVIPSFDSPKSKRYLLRDTLEFYMQSLFASFNYVKCRITDGVRYTAWSNTAMKPFVSTAMHGTTIYQSHPLINLNYFPYSKLNGMQLQMGTNPARLRHHFNDVPFAIQDTFEFADGETVHYRVRRYTPIDTSMWTGLKSFVYKSNPGICMSPKIIYNGNAPGKDSFHLHWKERDSSSSEGYHLFLGRSPMSFDGIVELPPGSRTVVIYKNEYPEHWYFALYPKCSYPRGYSQISPVWYPLNALTSANGDQIFENRVRFFYNASSHTLETDSEIGLACTLYDLNGKCLYSDSISTNNNGQLPVLAPGIYYARLQHQGFVQTIKLLLP